MDDNHVLELHTPIILPIDKRNQNSTAFLIFSHKDHNLLTVALSFLEMIYQLIDVFDT